MTGVKANPGRLVLHIAALIDGTGAAQQQDAVIVIEGGVIRSVDAAPGNPAGPPARPHGELVTFESGVAVPGFIDAHVHCTLFADGRSYEEMAAEPDAAMAGVAARNALTHLRAG